MDCLILGLHLFTILTMKQLLLLQAVFLLSFSFMNNSYGQSADLLEKAYQHIESKYGLSKTAVGDLKIKSQYRSSHNQAEHVHFNQTFGDIDIISSEINLTILKDGSIISIGHNLKALDQFPVLPKQPSLSAGEAIPIAAGSLGQVSRSVPAIIKHTSDGTPVFDKSNISLQDIPVQLGYLPTPSGEYRLVYTMLIESASKGKVYQSIIDAVTGQSVANDIMTLQCKFEHGYLAHNEECLEEKYTSISTAALTTSSTTMMPGQYRVLPVSIESPSHGNFELLTGVDDVDASPFGWHDINGAIGAEYTYTRGNNVYAFLDRNWDYFPDLNIDGGANLIFDFPYDNNAEPVTNQSIAVTNLFYWNNVMHDFSYQYGFDEAAGNFQENNYTNNGAEGDYIEAHAQFGDNNPSTCGDQANNDVDCINNADFSIVPDGFNGRMRMFTWNRDNSSKFLDVLEPTDLAGKILTGLPEFGFDITTVPITGEVVVIDDGSFDPTKGCNPVAANQNLTGKIALIDRGVCDFSLKVYNAQEAGAIGAIICNFEDVVIPMGTGENGEDVTIPSVFISSVECNRIRLAAGTGLVISLVAPESGGPLLRDGSLDNSIIAHEYAHGITSRLVGGPSTASCLSAGFGNAAEEASGMSEGWSDFFGLITTVQPGDTGEKRRGIGTYANKEATNGRGIRKYPYSTDMTINPYTYADIILEAEQYGTGTVWCTMLWDLYWAFSDVYGWDPDLYHGTGGNNIAIQLVMDGLKMQQCYPGFADARNAILAADMINNGGANQCLIWSVFARRGLGDDASQGDPHSWSDGTEGFLLPVACRDDINISKTMSPEVIAGGEIEVVITVNNFKNFALTNVFIEDPIPDGCSYLPGSANIEPITGNSLVWTINSLDPDEEIIISYLLKTDQTKNSVRQYYDDMEGTVEFRWDLDFDPAGSILNLWTIQDTIVRSGEAAWRVGAINVESKQILQNFEPYSISGDYPVYRFYQYYNTEVGIDGGFLEISTDGGELWASLEDKIFRNSYPRKLQYSTFAIPNLGAFSGRSNLSNEMEATYIDLRDYIGEDDVKIRYRFGTNETNGGDGWYVDDTEIMDAIVYNAEVCLSSDQSSAICAEAPERGTIVDSEITISTADELTPSSFAILPNPAGNVIQVVKSALKDENAVITIYDLTGQILSTTDWNLAAGINQKTIAVSSFPSGIYVIQVKTGEGMRSEKFVKE